MSTRRRSAIVIATAVIVSILATWALVGPVSAAIGNRGVPVYGRLTSPLPQSDSDRIKLYSADDSFNAITEVPAGKYLLVTDIEFTPDAGTDTAALLHLTAVVPNTSQSIVLRSTDASTHAINCTTPLLTVGPGQFIEISNAWFSDKWGYVHISGMLVDNVTYIPVVLEN